MSIVTDIANLENLMWAWQKAKNAYRVGDIWFDTLELANFEANTHLELMKIHEDLINGTYELNELQPLPYPKGESYKEEDGTIEAKVRQTFYVSVRDQVTWLAVVNVIGPKLDFEMPFWSYGNRLYYSIWYEDGENKSTKTLKAGWYRSSTKNIFRAWKQSWPLFRHTVALTIKKMSKANESDYSEQEKEMDINNENLPENFRANYLQKEYWSERKGEVNDLYWASIDFEKFYPNLKIESVVNNIRKYSTSVLEDSDFQKILIQLTSFKILVSEHWTEEYKNSINLKLDENSMFQGIPTGLFVAGFLANVALIEVDKKVSEQLKNNRNIAHFRYVDDHVILGYDFDQLIEWIKGYETLIRDSGIGANIKPDKTEPKALSELLNPDGTACKCDNSETLSRKAKKECRLDPNFPTPLVTQTLAKVSNIADCDIDFLTEHEERQLISDLEHLLVTDFPEHELKSDTRISFAASMLSSIMPKKRVDYSEVYEIRKRIFQLTKEFEAIKRKDTSITKYNKHLITKYLFDNSNEKAQNFPRKNKNTATADPIISNIRHLHSELKSKIHEIEINALYQKLHVFKLLIKAAKENHDKVKLWSRLIDYCYNTSITKYKSGKSKENSLLTILQAVQYVHKVGKTHKLSHNFLLSQFVLILSDRLIKAMSVMINNEDYIKRENAEIYINACLDNNLLDKLFKEENTSSMEYYIKSFKYFKMTLGTAIFISESQILQNNKYGILDWNSNPQVWCQNNGVDIDKYLYYLMYRLNDKKSSSYFEKWDTLTNQSNYPAKFLNPFNQPNYDDASSVEDDKITLFQWINKCRNAANNPNAIFDPRHSEWMALKIVDRLVDIYINETTSSAEDFLSGNNSNSEIYINPHNYLLPRKWIEEQAVKSWSYYNNESNIDFSNIKYNKEGAKSDSRYMPESIRLSYESDQGEFLAMYGFAVILCQLISHDTSFPWIWNIEDKNIEYSNYIFSRIENITISSYTKAIIMACTLSRSRESFRLSEVFNSLASSGVSKDTNNDPPIIATLSSFKAYINKAIHELGRLHTSVGEDKPRQMIPVRLRRITEKQPF